MTPQEKAQELYNKFYYSLPMLNNFNEVKNISKKCVLITIDEVIDNLELLRISHLGTYTNPNIFFWNEVKNEIEKI